MCPRAATESTWEQARAEASKWIWAQILSAVKQAETPSRSGDFSEGIATFRQDLFRISYQLRFGHEDISFEHTLEQIAIAVSASGLKVSQIVWHTSATLSEIGQCYIHRFLGLVVEGVLLPIDLEASQ